MPFYTRIQSIVAKFESPTHRYFSVIERIRRWRENNTGWHITGHIMRAKCAYNSNAEQNNNISRVNISGAPSLRAIRPHSADPAALKTASGNAHTSGKTHLCFWTLIVYINYRLTLPNNQDTWKGFDVYVHERKHSHIGRDDKGLWRIFCSRI